MVLLPENHIYSIVFCLEHYTGITFDRVMLHCMPTKILLKYLKPEANLSGV